MTETEFYMVGLIHGERKGREILRRLLSSLKPDVITLEFTNFGLSFRKKNYRLLKRRLFSFLRRNFPDYRKETIERIINFLRPPYEYVVSKKYAEKNRIPLYLIDMDFFSFMRLRYINELLDPQNLMTLLSQDELPSLDEKRTARMYFEKNVRLFTYTPEMRVRDEYARRLIDKIIEQHKARRLIHICGWQHLGDESGYFSDLSPKKIFIHDKAIRI